MKQRPRIYYSEAQKAMMWDRWQRGEARIVTWQRDSSRSHVLVDYICPRPAQDISAYRRSEAAPGCRSTGCGDSRSIQ